MVDRNEAVNYYSEILQDYGKKIKALGNDIKKTVLSNFKNKKLNRNLIVSIVAGLVIVVVLSVVIGIISVRKRKKSI